MIIDYSHHNGILNWQKAVDAGVIGAYLKASQGTTLLDSKYKVNSSACPLRWTGAYHFFDYWTGHYDVGDEKGFGIRQANYFIKAVGDWDTTLPLCVDIENNSASGWENLNTVIPRALLILRGFVDRFKDVKGYYPLIYCSSYFTRYLKEFTACPLWVAHYDVENPVYYNWKEHVLWQYSSKGDGKMYGNGAGNDYVDLNKLGKPLTDWMAMRLPIEPLAQRDPKWKDIQLGTSSVTIGGYGCLITCAAMMLKYFGLDTDPERLNTWLKANKGYHNSNWFVWGSIEQLLSGLTFGYRYNYAALDKVDAQLVKGLPVIINVDLNPATPALDEHWVLVVGKVGGSYIINDPWTGTQFKYEEKYGNPSIGMRIVCTYNFAGTVEPVPEPTPIEAGQVVATLVNLNIRKGAGTSYGVWATAPKGTQLDVLEVKGDWVRVGWNQWCMSKYNGVKYLEAINGR